MHNRLPLVKLDSGGGSLNAEVMDSRNAACGILFFKEWSKMGRSYYTRSCRYRINDAFRFNLSF